jgi:hypothetical protein
MTLNDFYRLQEFAMAGRERRHFCRIGFMRVGIGRRCNQVVVKSLRGIERKYRKIDYSRPPSFTVGQRKLKSQAADRVGRIGDVGIAAAERKAPDHRHAPAPEHNGLRKPRSPPVAIEKSPDAHAFGVIATETGVDSVDPLKTVDEPPRC